MSNNISIIGRLARDGEAKFLPNGTALFEFTVADSQGFGDKKTTNWFKCQLWGKQAEGGVTQYLVKGAQVAIFGELTIREFTNKEGAKQLSPEVRVNKIELLGGKQEGQDQPKPQQAKPVQQAKPAADFSDFEDDVAF
jgi:single-strand DNA-binding protein